MQCIDRIRISSEYFRTASIMNSKTLESADPRFASNSSCRPEFDKNPEIEQNRDEILQSQPPECMCILSCCINWTYRRLYFLSAPILPFFLLLMLTILHIILIHPLFLFLFVFYLWSAFYLMRHVTILSNSKLEFVPVYDWCIFVIAIQQITIK